MKQIALALLVLLVIDASALAGIEKSIFDDDWTPPTPRQVQPPVPPVAPTPKPAPSPDPTAAPKPVKPEVEPAPAEPTPPPAVVAQPARLAVPTAAAQADAWKLIKEEIYKDDIANARTPAQKVELARKLLAVAGDTTKDMVGKYVLLAQAKELAIGSGDPPTAFKCLDELGKVYEIDYPAVKLDLFSALANTMTTRADREIVIEGLNAWADWQVRNDRYDAAKRACDIALGMARKDRGSRSIEQTDSHRKRIAEIEAGSQSVKAAIATLATNPKDATANLTAGQFYCFTKGEWASGLPLLAAGADATLATIARTEISGVSGAAAKGQLADGWWEIALKASKSERPQIQMRAVRLYRAAIPELVGLDRAKAEKRVMEVYAEREAAGMSDDEFIRDLNLPPRLEWTGYTSHFQDASDAAIGGDAVEFSSPRGHITFAKAVPSDATISFSILMKGGVTGDAEIFYNEHGGWPSFKVTLARTGQIVVMTHHGGWREIASTATVEPNGWTHVTIAWGNEGTTIVMKGLVNHIDGPTSLDGGGAEAFEIGTVNRHGDVTPSLAHARIRISGFQIPKSSESKFKKLVE